MEIILMEDEIIVTVITFQTSKILIIEVLRHFAV